MNRTIRPGRTSSSAGPWKGRKDVRSYSDNAILAKVRALYGKRLREQDYEQLLGKKTVGEVAAYLKNETYYAENLKEVKEELIHRGQLENLVRRRTLDTYSRLNKYACNEALFLQLYVMQNEVEQLLLAVRLLNSGSMDRYIVSLPVHLAKHMSFDLFALAKVRTYDQLLEVLERSAYYRIVGRFRPSGSHRIVDITSLEAALLAHYYGAALESVERQYRGEAREALKKILHFQLGVHNLSVIVRMYRYLNAPREMILPRIVRVEGVNQRFLDRVLATPDFAAAREVIARSSVLRRYPFDWDVDTQNMSAQMRRLRRRVDQRIFRFATHPIVAVLSYMALLEIELSNIVFITEGIRYGLPAEKIRRLLCSETDPRGAL